MPVPARDERVPADEREDDDRNAREPRAAAPRDAATPHRSRRIRLPALAGRAGVRPYRRAL